MSEEQKDPLEKLNQALQALAVNYAREWWSKEDGSLESGFQEWIESNPGYRFSVITAVPATADPEVGRMRVQLNELQATVNKTLAQAEELQKVSTNLVKTNATLKSENEKLSIELRDAKKKIAPHKTGITETRAAAPAGATPAEGSPQGAAE